MLSGVGVNVGTGVLGTKVGASVGAEKESVEKTGIALLTLENTPNRMIPTAPKIMQVKIIGTITLMAVTPNETPAVTFATLPMLLETSSLLKLGIFLLKSL